MAMGSKPGLPPRNFSKTYVHDQLAGHSPNTPWWATPLAIFGFIALFAIVLGLLLVWR